ncbi:MAG TPA: autotransporter-associated beta strand repeat-containing protein, partial [Humisphaera sp.]
STSVLSLASSDATPVSINPDGNTLTLAQATAGSNAILLAAGAGNLTVGSNVAVGGSQTWTNSSTTGSVLRVGSAGTTVALGANTVTVAGPGTTTVAGDLSGAGGVLTKTSTGTLNLTGGPGTLKQLNLNAAGVFDIGASNLTINNGGGDTIQSSVTTGTAFINATGGGAIVLAVNATNGPDNGVANGGTLQINARVTGTSTFEFFKSGVTTGVIYLANNANDFTGGVVLNAGVVRTDTLGTTGSPSGLGTGANVYINGGTLRYTGAGETSNKVVNLLGTIGGGTIDQSGTGRLVVSGNFANPGVGSKTLTLTGSTAGVGEIGGAIVNNSTVGSTLLTATFAAGATTVTLNSVDGVAVGASITGTGIAAGTTVSAVNASTRVVTLSTAATAASAAAGASYSVTGVVNPTAVTKTGSGTWVLSGANTYTGPTNVTAGTLLVNGSVTSSVTANGATATVGGSGSIAAALTVTAGRLSPGNAAPGALGVTGTLTLANAASYLAELGGTAPGSYDQTLVGGSATLGGAALSVAPVNGFVPSAGDVFFILARGDSAANTTFFANAAEGDTVNLVNGGTGQITYLANWTGSQTTSTLTGGNDVAIYNVTGVPEPTG